MKATPMTTMNGPTVEYTLVYRIFPRTVHSLRGDGFYHPEPKKYRGHLVMSKSMGRIMYHHARELLRFKCDC